MARRPGRCRRPPPDPAVVLAGLRSPDERTRMKALHSICPCAAGYLLYEQFRADVKRLQKDPSPRVRATALHLEHDACQIEQIEAGLDQAEEQGWRYSDPDWVSAKKQRQATRYWLPLTSDPAIPITTDLTLATRGETAKVERERRSG